MGMGQEYRDAQTSLPPAIAGIASNPPPAMLLCTHRTVCGGMAKVRQVKNYIDLNLFPTVRAVKWMGLRASHATIVTIYMRHIRKIG
jgi:hypothetical protein